jgi:hypothetical protein
MGGHWELNEEEAWKKSQLERGGSDEQVGKNVSTFSV